MTRTCVCLALCCGAAATLGDEPSAIRYEGGLALDAHAVVADIGPKGKPCEDSIALAEALGLKGDPHDGGASSGVYRTPSTNCIAPGKR
jgi:hypothetical protein